MSRAPPSVLFAPPYYSSRYFEKGSAIYLRLDIDGRLWFSNSS